MSRSSFTDSSMRGRAKAANRRAILDAARQIFTEIGYENATVRDVIKRTRLASGTFYNYFRSKEELFVAISAEHLNGFIPYIEEAKKLEGGFEEKTMYIYKLYFEYVAEEIKRYGKPLKTNVPLPSAITLPPVVEAVFDTLHDEVIKRLAIEEIEGLDSEYLAAIGIGMAKEIRTRFLRRDNADPEEAAHYAATFFLSGLSAFKTELQSRKS